MASSFCYSVLCILLLTADIVNNWVDAVSIVNATGTVKVPCGDATTYGPEISVGTQFLLQNCDNNTLGTSLSLVLNESSPAALGGFSIVVRDSRRVGVVLGGSVVTDIINLSISIDNVTNDSDEQIVGSHVCSSVYCINLISVYVCRSLINASIFVSHITSYRNQPVVYIQNLHGNVSRLSAVFVDAVLVNNASVIGLDTIDGGIHASIITLDSMQQIISTDTTIAGFVMLLLTNAPAIFDTVVNVKNSSIDGATYLPICIVTIQQCEVIGGHMSVTDFRSEVAAYIVSALALTGSSASGGTTLAVSNFTSTSVSSSTSVVVLASSTLSEATVLLSMIYIITSTSASPSGTQVAALTIVTSTISNGTTLEISSFSAVSLSNATTAVILQSSTLREVTLLLSKASIVVPLSQSVTNVAAFSIFASTITGCNITFSRLTLTGIAVPMAILVIGVVLPPYVIKRTSLQSSNIVLTECLVASPFAAFVNVGSTDIVDVALTIHRTSTEGYVYAPQYFPVALSLSTATNLFISITNSSLAGAYPVISQDVNLVNLTAYISNSTLNCSSTGLMFSRPLAAIGFHNATIVDSRVMIADTDVIGMSTTPCAGQAVHLEQTTLTGCTISVVFNSVTLSGGLLLISECTLNHSNVDVSVSTNISVPAAFPTAVLIVNSSIITNGSHVVLYLPQEVVMTSSSASSGLVTLAALYFHNVVVEASSLEVLSRGSPYAAGASRLTWSSSCVSAVGIEAINGSSLVLGGESIAFQSSAFSGGVPTTIVISRVNISDSIAVLSAHDDSNIQIVNCRYIITAAGASDRFLKPLLVLSLPAVSLLGGTIEVNISTMDPTHLKCKVAICPHQHYRKSSSSQRVDHRG
ncbi:Hypothetical protein, putative [Bodo saltans]|uniref:Membrane-associated protein n=1 Tax=Bodo saltans TaxID=75058 RepID=A0A0S4JC88_BODSA|nr:Hypothetical protein, putative [Bodo saltans]|eukprot:CUG85831.1 Hypothetical protein, putative [Bodo saltans]